MPHIKTVITKKELSRNEAIFRDNDELFAEIKKEIIEAVNESAPVKKLSFPAQMEKSFKRVEETAYYLLKLQENNITAQYLTDDVLGYDAHTVKATVNNIDEFILCI